MSSNNLSGTAEAIAQLISVCYYLQYINLANTLMQDEEVMIIIKATQNINSLRYVDLMSYSINDEMALELQNTVDENPAVISFQISKLCFKKIEVALMTLFSIVVNLQEISICFSDYENDQVDAAASLINNSPNLQYLYLENCSLLEIDISDIIIALSRTTTLQYFSLINIVITDKVDDGIAVVIENNTQLKHFKLVACKVTEKGFTQCIQSFNITRLSHLVLTKMDNVISHITRQLKRPICDSLTHLNLSNVHLDITKLSFLSLPSLTNLQHLNLSHNPLTDESADILTPVICNNNGLNHLDLCDCKLQSEGIRVVADSLQVIKVLYLDMSLNTIDINDNVLPVLFSSLNAIECLYLPYFKLKEKEIDEIIDFISNAVHLKFIDFGPNTIPKDMSSDFKNIMFVSKGNKQICFNTEGIKRINFNNHETENLYHSLHYLNINNVIINNTVGNIVATLIANSPELEHLEMAGGKWNITSATKCFRALQNNSHLKYLNFSNNYNSYFTLTEIFCLVIGCSALKLLDLHNCCGLNDTISMTTENPEFLHLIYLDLSNNFIDDGAVDYLSVLIATSFGLEYLSFYNCKLSSCGIQNISSALKVTSSLKFLDINFSDIEGINLVEDQVATLLANNKVLQELRLPNLVLDNNMFHQIQSRQLVIKELQQLTINDCIFTDRNTNTIISLVANNSTLRELTVFNCEMSMKSKIKFTYIATALYLQCLKFDTITVTDIKYSPNASLHCNKSKFKLTDDDVVAVMTVNNNLGELIMFKLVLNQNRLNVFSTNAVTIRYLKVFHIQDCIFTDYCARYVAFLITNNATTIQSFSLISCQMSTKQKMIITKALYKLDVILLQHLNIRDILYFDDVIHVTTANLKYSYTKTNCELTDDIITAVVTDHINFNIPKLVVNQNTLAKLKSNLKLIKGIIHLTINDYIFIFDVETDRTVASIITNNDCIQELTLSNCLFPPRHLEILKRISFLRTLNLVSFDKMCCSKNIEDLIISIITNNPGLGQFAICSCEITESGLVRVMHSIAKGLRNLLYVNFSHLKWSCEVVNHIITVITCNTKLKHINLCNCQLLTLDIKSIIQAAKILTTLEYFDLSCNHVTGYLANDITTLIANNKNIKELSLPNYTILINNNHLKVILNTVTDLLVNDIATLMTTNKNISEMSLLNCTLNNDQLKVVLNAMKECSVLPYVDFTIKQTMKDVIENNSIVEQFTKAIKLLMIQSMIMLQSHNLVKYSGIDYLAIVGCSFDWNILKQFFAYSATLNTLILCDCQLYSEISEIVEICTHLSYLDLTNVKIAESSKLKSSPTWLSHNPIILKPKLKSVSINCMDFTEQMMKDILNILWSSKNLDNLAMVKCNYIGRYEVSSFWMPFSACKNLVCLDLSYSQMNGEIVDSILSCSKNLANVEMASCSFDKEEVSLVCNRLCNVSYIVHLNLNNNKNVCYYASEIAATITCNINLRHIELAACNFDINGIIKICRSIRLCSRFQYINLSHNEIVGNAIDALVSILHSDYLEHINLQNCGLKSAGSKNVIVALESIFTLQSVDLSLNEMAEDSSVHVAGMIANNENIEVLCLPDCVHYSAKSDFLSPTYLYLHMMRCIFDHIKGAKSLKCVEFGSSQVNDILANDVAAITARGLVQVKFSELILTHNGFKQLTNGILIIEGLNDITITSVHFTYTESCHLATLITNNKSVKLFDISNCVMSDEGKNIIFKAMTNLTSLKFLCLNNIVISDTVEDKVLDVIANNTNLEYLEVTGCEMNTVKLNEAISTFNNLKVVF